MVAVIRFISVGESGNEESHEFATCSWGVCSPVLGLRGEMSAAWSTRGKIVRKRFGVLVAVTAVAVLPFGVAHASDKVVLPEDGYFSAWEDPNGGGTRYLHTPQNACHDGCDIGGWDGDNELSAVDNGTNCTVTLYADDGYKGRTYTVPKNTAIWNLETVGFDNEAESYELNC